MKKINLLIATIACLFTLQFAWAQPGNYTVEAGAFSFTPSDMSIEVGSTVTWINVGGLHDVDFVTNTITGDDFGNPESFSLSFVYSAGVTRPVEF